MARFPEAEARLFTNIYLCLKCNARNKFDARRVRLKKTKCRECNHTRARPKRKDKA